MDDLMDTKQAARYLGLSYSTLCTWRSTGRGPWFIKAGSRVVYRKSDIDVWCGRQTLIPRGNENRNP